MSGNDVKGICCRKMDKFQEETLEPESHRREQEYYFWITLNNIVHPEVVIIHRSIVSFLSILS